MCVRVFYEGRAMCTHTHTHTHMDEQEREADIYILQEGCLGAVQSGTGPSCLPCYWHKLKWVQIRKLARYSPLRRSRDSSVLLYWDSLLNWAGVQFKVSDGNLSSLITALYGIVSEFSFNLVCFIAVARTCTFVLPIVVQRIFINN